MKISANTVVSFDYTLKDKDGKVIDSSAGRAPLNYLHGAGNIIAGLEKEMEGLGVGDKKHVEVAPEEGYGVFDKNLLVEVPRTGIDFAGTIEKGMRFHVQNPDGGIIPFTVVEIAGDKVRLDGNHPLAGVTLFFDVEVKNIRAATEKETALGRPDEGDSCCSCGGDCGGDCGDDCSCGGHCHD